MIKLDDDEVAYAAALRAFVQGGSFEAGPFAHLQGDVWPSAADIIRLHQRVARKCLAETDAPGAEERAAEFLARLFETYDMRQLDLKRDFADVVALEQLMTWTYDVPSQRLHWSRQALERIRRTATSAPRTPAEAIEQLVHPDDRRYVHTMLAQVVADGQARDIRYRFLLPGSDPQWRRCRAIPRRDANGQVTSVLLVSQDITDAIKREEEVHLLSTILDHIHDVVLVTEPEPIDPPGPRIIYVNQAFERMTGYASEEVLGKTPRILQGPGTSPEARARIRAALRNWQPITLEILNYRKDGSEFWAELAITPVTRPDGWVTHWVAVQREVTERRKAEAQQRQRSKMEAVGQLAAGIAHNFNNILAIIQGYGEIVRRDVAHTSPPIIVQRLDKLLRATKRGAELVRDLMLFTKQRTGQPERVNIFRLLNETLELARPLLPAEIEILPLCLMSPEEETKALCAYVDPGYLSQAIINLIINARDAMPSGGQLTVTLGRRPMGQDVINQMSARVVFAHLPKPGNYVFIAVEDTGVGMDAETQQRIFEPFFTTKGVGQGTGLGLATVYGLVSESQGFITVDSAPGQGTTITLFFPITSSDGADADESSGEFVPVPLNLPPEATALVVEDEPELCQLLVEHLSALGFARVHQLHDGSAVLPFVRRHRQGLALVVSDVSLPHVSGPQLITDLAGQHWCDRFVLISGLEKADEGIRNLPPSVRIERLAKPFSRKQLFSAVYALFQTKQ